MNSKSKVAVSFLVAFSIIEVLTMMNTTSTEIFYTNNIRKGQVEESSSVVQEEQAPTKFYAVHIGPSKTGTSTIQSDLAQNPFQANTFREDMDKVIYVGKRSGGSFDDPNKSTKIERVVTQNQGGSSITLQTPNLEVKAYGKAVKCMKDFLNEYYNSTINGTDQAALDEQLETNEELRLSMKQKFISVCWNDHSYMLNYSLIDSNEGYSCNHHDQSKNMGIRLRMFDILGYERLIVVATYRRYAEWIVSAYTQSIKNQGCFKNLKKNIACESWRDYISRNLKIYKKKNFGTMRYGSPVVTLPKIVAAGPSKLETRILNFFQQPSSEKQSIITELYCHALGMELTPHSCKYSRALDIRPKDNSTGNKTHANKGTTSDSVYQTIVATAYQLGFLLPPTNNEEKSSTKDKSALKLLHKITAGGKVSIIGTNTSNVVTYKDLSKHHIQVHNQTWIESLPILCPDRVTLEKILEHSLELEKLLMPDFYASPLGKEEHIQLFWGKWYEEKKLFCRVDIETLFTGATSWDEIINERMVKFDWVNRISIEDYGI